MAKLLIVDDESHICESLCRVLHRAGHTVATAISGETALDHLNHQEADCILSDMQMPGMSGLALLRQVKAQDESPAMVMMSGHRDVTSAVEAMKAGAFDYLMKPFGKDAVLQTVQEALRYRTGQIEKRSLKRKTEDGTPHAQMIGTSSAWRRIRALAERVAPSRATVLITGESGTGKEGIANLLHQLSPRAKQPFVTLNAAALPDALLESELFGYEKGAFTGALQRKPGRFEAADGGTLFLDEIGELPLAAQAKLLRVLQERAFERLGSSRTLHVDVRIVAATNNNLQQALAARTFREDLYYRLNVVTIPLPPLRERRDDIPLLATHFLSHYAKQNGKAITAIHKKVLYRLQSYHWPGNVRELENVIARAVVIASEPTIRVEDLPRHLQSNRDSESDHALMLPPNATLAEVERLTILHAMQKCGGNRQAAARLLDIGITTLYRKLKAYQRP